MHMGGTPKNHISRYLFAQTDVASYRICSEVTIHGRESRTPPESVHFVWMNMLLETASCA